VSLSPDDRLAAVTVLDDEGRAALWVYDVARGLRTRLTFAPEAWAGAAAWYPDSRTLAYVAIGGGGVHVHRRAVDGTEDATPLIEAEGVQRPFDVSSDGSWLSFMQRRTGTRQDLWLLGLQPGAEPRPLLQSPFDETAGRFSPSGPWIAYESDESRRPEVYVTGFPDPGRKQQVSSGGGVQPFWRGDGAELFYTTLDGWLMGVPVGSAGGELTFGDPQRLFRVDRAGIWRLVTGAADGQRFLVATREAPAPPALQLIVDWPALVTGAGE
jgi:eukaryotic-like serine/threonine-protein kinase